METQALIGLVALGVAMLSGLGLVYYFLFPKQQTNLRSLMGSSATGVGLSGPMPGAVRVRGEISEQDLQHVKESAKKQIKKKQGVTLDEKFFRAGIFSDKDKKEFLRLRLIVPLFTAPLLGFLCAQMGAQYAIMGIVFGALLGLQIPFSILDRRIAHRSEEIMFYLPLVIEQIAIGVSSSLDVGPCLQRVVQMADERDTHNPVTELVRHAQFHIKSGVSLEEAMTEIGKLSGQTELKHTFMSLAQVAKHGGEITRQLQELADAVAGQRETKIEAKIKKLELEATGPVGLVFLGFLIILLIGFGLEVMKAFK